MTGTDWLNGDQCADNDNYVDNDGHTVAGCVTSQWLYRGATSQISALPGLLA